MDWATLKTLPMKSSNNPSLLEGHALFLENVSLGKFKGKHKN